MSDTMIINNLLCFVSTAKPDKSNDYIIQCCFPFFKIKEITEAKELLYSFSNEKLVKRRGDDPTKAHAEITDILKMFSKYEDDNFELPRFVADSYASMPPVNGFDKINQHLILLSEEISSLKEEIKVLRSSETKDNIIFNDNTLIKNDLSDIKNILRDLKSKYLESEVLQNGISLNNKPVEFSQSVENQSLCTPSPKKVPVFNNVPSFIVEHSDDSHGVTFTPSAPPLSQHSNLNFASIINSSEKFNKPDYRRNSVNKTNLMNKMTQPILKPANNNHPPNKIIDEDGFELVISKKKRGIVGNKKSTTDTKLKSAERILDIYVGNCDISTTCDTLTEYILDESSMKLKNCIELKSSHGYSKSFKISVLSNERDLLLKPEIWPNGVSVRKFFNSHKY